jgi:hypothetical protein
MASGSFCGGRKNVCFDRRYSTDILVGSQGIWHNGVICEFRMVTRWWESYSGAIRIVRVPLRQRVLVVLGGVVEGPFTR